MKKARASPDRGAPQPAALPPALPPFEELDALAAAETPTVESAWWITHQVSEHVFSTIAHSDPRTGEPLAGALTEILRDIRNATAIGSRPFPRDRLLSAAEFSSAALEHLLDRHRHRLVRVHEQLPFHRLREVDTRSMAWLARQPGRNIREKLSGRTHALGVKRDVSADTTENRLLRTFAKLLVQRARGRLGYTIAYDGTAADVDRVRRLEDCVRLCDERMRRSDLARIPTLTRLQANNVLLSDPHYSRVFRAWKWLRDDEAALRGSWKDSLQRTRVLLCWMVAAQLVTRERVVVTETLGRVLTGRGDDQVLGIDVLGTETIGTDWSLNPSLQFLVFPARHDDAAFRIRISLYGDVIIAHVATLGGRGLLAEESVSTLTFEVRPTSERLQPQRGIGIAVHYLEGALRGTVSTYADLAGLTPLATQIARQILERCDVNPSVERHDPTAVGVADGARLGIQIGSASLHVSAQQEVPLVSSPWALAVGLAGDQGGIDWLEGRADRELVMGAGGRSLWATGDVMDPDEQADAGMRALAAERVLGSLASELKVPADARVAYAVPDDVDEFSQRSLRSAFGASFHRPVPVWRSVAAAISWAAVAGDLRPGPGELVVIVDTEFGGVSLTVLTARDDAKLERTHHASRGVYWERKPPLPPDEQLETLGWPHVLRDYARMLVERELSSLDPEIQARIVEDLLRSGKIDALVARGGSILVQVPSSRRAIPDVVEFLEDPIWFETEVGRWTERLELGVKDAISTLGRVHVLHIGGPCAYRRFQRRGRQTGRIGHFNEAQKFGFVICDEEREDVFFHINSVQVPEGVVLRRGLAVEFDIGMGRKGPEAQHLTTVSPLAGWLRRRTVVTPHALALGARECLLRLDTGSLAWREWLPELSLEVVRDGHFGELPLLERGTFVDPLLGDAVQFTVPETLTLARGNRWFAFPLLLGRHGRRPIMWEARLESPAFPLDHDVHARLRLSYRYGLDNSYELSVEPASSDDAPFARVEAKWIKGGENVTTTLIREPLALERMPWEEAETASFLDAARGLNRLGDERYSKFLFAVTRKCWSQGRSLATAPAAVRRTFPTFCEQLMDSLPPELNVQDMPRALGVLSLLHEDAPPELIGWLLELDHLAGDGRVPTDGGAPVPLYRETAEMLANLVGDGTGERAALLHRLLGRLRRHSQRDTFDAKLAGLTMRALGNAAWRHPSFIGALAAASEGAALVIAQCRRSLNNLLGRVPVDLSSEDQDQRQRVSRQYGPPFVDACKLLLALMAVDPSARAVAPLRCGSASGDALAKAVRQLDARFAAGQIDLVWRVRLDVEVPESLRRMSPVAFVLNGYLAEGAGANLVRVAGMEVD